MRLRIIPSTCVVLAVTLCLLSITGCGTRTIDPGQVADAQSAYDRALVAYEQADFSAALTDLTAAIETPGLPPDLLVDAHLKRARCRAEAGNFDDALAEIDLAESAAGEMDQVHLTRGIVFRLQGNETAARSEFQQAKQINPKVQLPR